MQIILAIPKDRDLSDQFRLCLIMGLSVLCAIYSL